MIKSPSRLNITVKKAKKKVFTTYKNKINIENEKKRTFSIYHLKKINSKNVI